MKLYSVFFAIFVAGYAANTTAAKAREAPLFSSHDLLKLTLPVDFSEMCRPRETEDCGFSPTALEYEDAEGARRSLPVKIRIRGGWRSLARNCRVPPLFVRFAAEDVAGTPFEGQSLLAMTTHCGKGLSLAHKHSAVKPQQYEGYLLKEYMGYRLYNVITDASLRVRLVRIRYQDPDKPRIGFSSYAFFAEHFDAMGARFDAEVLPRGSFDHELLETHAADQLALFQFMIGNTDWSIVRQRNIVLIRLPDGKHVPAPYDLDMSGLVNAHYAGPPPSLPIESVKERYYLGFCHPHVDWDVLFGEFRLRQEAILSLSGDIPGLARFDRKLTRRYLEKFYGILSSADAREQEIIRACHPWPPSPIDHMTPQD